jgi:hypothetical protein
MVPVTRIIDRVLKGTDHAEMLVGCIAGDKFLMSNPKIPIFGLD